MFGKHREKPLQDVALEDPDYVYWLASERFTPYADGAKAMKDWAVSWKQRQQSKSFVGNLTYKIKTLLNYRQDVDDILNTIDAASFQFNEHPLGLPLSLVQKFRSLKGIDDASFGCFFDYLMRRMIAEHTGQTTYKDARATTIAGDPDGSDAFRIDVPESETIFKSYVKYSDLSIPTSSILRDISITSQSHNSIFQDLKPEKAQELADRVTWITPEEIAALRDSFSVLGDMQDGTVRLNPVLGSPSTPADADLIVGTKVWDLKTSNATSVADKLQCMGYAALARSRDILVDGMGIFNPIRNTYSTCDLSSWTKARAFLDIMEKDHIAKRAEAGRAEAERAKAKRKTTTVPLIVTWAKNNKKHYDGMDETKKRKLARVLRQLE